MRKGTKHTITVKRRDDRELMMSLYGQEAQTCSVKVGIFGLRLGAEKAENREAKRLACEVMKGIATRVCGGNWRTLEHTREPFAARRSNVATSSPWIIVL